MRLRHGTSIKFVAPLAAVDGLVDTKFRKRAGIRQVRQLRIAKLELHDQRRVLHETLIIFGPGG